MNRFLDIYQFTHFRKFLEEYQVARAKEEPGFTRTEICNLLGLEKSRSYFADVVRGKKVSPRMVQKFIEILELDKKEAKYFETLGGIYQPNRHLRTYWYCTDFNGRLLWSSPYYIGN